MPISGLLVTLRQCADQNLTVQTVRQRSELTVGELNARWLPVALEARDDEHSREVHDWLMTLPGVEYVDVTSVNFEGDEASIPAPALDVRHPRSQRRSIPASALND